MVTSCFICNLFLFCTHFLPWIPSQISFNKYNNNRGYEYCNFFQKKKKSFIFASLTIFHRHYRVTLTFIKNLDIGLSM